jgi:hypothetical protein
VVNHTFERDAFHRYLPAVWEFFRAVSGLASIAALIAIVAGMTVIAEQRPAPAIDTLATDLQTTQPSVGEPPLTAAPRDRRDRAMVFYLVATEGQAFIADWGENVEGTNVWRDYRILYARDDAEVQAVQQAVMEYMLQQGDVKPLRVVDLRSVGQ